MTNQLSKQFLREIDKITSKRNTIFPNQTETAIKIHDNYVIPDKVITFVIAKTQGGKTGTMLGFLKQLYSSPDSTKPPLDNVYIITALSDNDWKKQMNNRMPETLHQHIYHRPELIKKFQPSIEGKNDILILMDEVQIGAKLGQTVEKCFTEAGLMNIQNLIARNIHIVLFTATPSGLMFHIPACKNHQTTVIMDHPRNYTSPMDILRNGRIKQFTDLCGVNNKGVELISDEQMYENLNDLKTSILSFRKPSYHFIRIQKGYQGDVTRDNIHGFMEGAGEDIEYMYLYDTDDQSSPIKNINKMLKHRPTKHTILFIKEKFRCSKTLKKKYIGVMCERYSHTINDEAIIQGLRMTGYDFNPKSIIYTNIESIEKYHSMFEKEFANISEILWNSNTTRVYKVDMRTEPVDTFAVKYTL
jgi:hypothetical protein